MRTTGILVPAFSTRRRDDLGIGDTEALKEWIDWAAEYQVGFLQLLPINENGTDESPYSSISSIALDPIYLSFDHGKVPYITEPDLRSARSFLGHHRDAELVEYFAVRTAKNRLLETSYSRFDSSKSEEQKQSFRSFKNAQRDWLDDYCLFKLLEEISTSANSWDQWPQEYSTPDSAREFLEKLHVETPEHTRQRLDFFAYVQWLCFEQWAEVRDYADSRNVKLMGDMPIGIAFHSADVFFHRELFLTDWFAGTPPDYHAAEGTFTKEWGQNWGVPLYNWEVMEKNGFSWWRSRIAQLTRVFHLFRIDHILGFYRAYAFPWHPRRNHEFLGISHETAASLSGSQLPRWFDRSDESEEDRAQNLQNGDLRLQAIISAAGAAKIIAEDLGWVPEYVRPHLSRLQIPGYKIPHWDRSHDNGAIPGSSFPEASFASYSTHDHDSLCAIWENCRATIHRNQESSDEADFWAAAGASDSLRILSEFAGIPVSEPADWPPYSDAIHWRLVKALLDSHSQYATLMVTSLFSIGRRINTPGTSGETNWRLRLKVSDLRKQEVGQLLKNLILLSKRHNNCT